MSAQAAHDAAAQNPPRPAPPTVLGIAGCSGSGKTTLANELARLFGGLRFHLDDYYLDLGHLPLAERARKNFDDPAMIQVPLLAGHIAALARGEAIDRPVYDFATHTRIAGRTERVASGPFLIVEGIFALCFEPLLPFYHLRIYIDAPDALCLERRMRRDLEERGRGVESVLRQWEHSVHPSSVAYVRPSAAKAELVVDGCRALDWKVKRVLAELRRRGLPSGTR